MPHITFIRSCIIDHYESMIPTATGKHLIFINQRLEFLIAQQQALWN